MGKALEETRTIKSIRNATIGVASQLATLVLGFATRTALVWGLGSYYLGLNSVLTSLIAVFSLAELGLGNAIVYSLYRPLANQDKEKIEAYLRIFKILYRVIGLLIFAIGFLATPFLPYLVNTVVTDEVIVAYVLFVCNTAISYFLFTYRTTLLQANQERYLVTLSELIYTLLTAIFQVLFFLIIGNFILGVAAQMIAQVGKSLFIVFVCKKRYSNISFSSKEKLQKKEKRELARNTYAMALGKFSDTASNNVPALVISSLIGLIQSGLYSNYQMISSAITTLMSQISGAVTASVGNLNVEADSGIKEDVFRKLSFISFCGYTISSACVYCGIDPFISAWLGNDYCLPEGCALAVAFNLLTIGILQSTVVFKDGCGIFFKGRFRPVISCILTVIFSVVLAIPFGVAGVMFAPAISRLFSAAWYDPWLVHKYVFGKKPFRHYLRMMCYLILGLVICILVETIGSFLPGSSWLLFFERIFMAFFLTIGSIVLIFHRSQSFVWCFGVIRGILIRKE